MESQKPAAPASVAARVKKEEKISNVRGIRNAFLVIIACAIADSYTHLTLPTNTDD